MMDIYRTHYCYYYYYLPFAVIVNILAILNYTHSEPLVRQQYVKSLCPGKSFSLKCSSDTNADYMVFIDEAIYGIRSQANNDCAYVPGDCYADEGPWFNKKCGADICGIVAQSSYKVTKCANKAPDYLHVLYKCIPRKLNFLSAIYDVCQTKVIRSPNGFITSPSYPGYKVVNEECTVTIQAPNDKVIKLWIFDIDVGPKTTQNNNNNNNQCQNDYVRVIDSTGVFTTCADERKAFDNRLCSSELFVSYRASTKTSKFRIYYEFVDRTEQPDCPTVTPPSPSPMQSTITVSSVTTSSQQFLPLVDLKAMDAVQAVICRGSETTIDIPNGYILFRLDSFYGVSQDGDCTVKKEHCKGPASMITCPLVGQCHISFYYDYALIGCGMQNANYIAFEYRFIPVRSSTNFTICQTTSIDGAMHKYGIITSPNYPKWTSNQDCKQIIMAPVGKIILIYLTDLNMDARNTDDAKCLNSYVIFNEDTDNVAVCGQYASENDNNRFVSCSNNLTLTYRSSTVDSTDFTGLRLYFEVVDRNDIYCGPSQSTTQGPMSTAKTTVAPSMANLTSLIQTYGGNALGAPCFFPFVYKGTTYEQCINADNDQDDELYWCSTTSNYDVDKKRGNCQLGLTSTVGFELCAGKKEKFYCPKGYVIYMISAEYGVTADGSCDAKKTRCTADASVVAQTCTNKDSCLLFHESKQIADCGGLSNYLRIDFTCIPNADNLGLPLIDICAAKRGSAPKKALVQSPSFPIYKPNLDCSYRLDIDTDKAVNVYIVRVNLAGYKILNPSTKICDSDSLRITDGVQSVVICARANARLVFKSCLNQINMSLVTGAKYSSLLEGVRIFYEVVDRSECPMSPNTTSSSMPPAHSSTTTQSYKEIWETKGISSPTRTKSFCTSATIQCPSGYVIVVRESFYGASSTNECFFRDGDFISYMRNPSEDSCPGQQSCSLVHSSTWLPGTCNSNMCKSNYFTVNYDCIPAYYTPKLMCDQTYNDTNGILSSFGYKTSCKARIATTINNVIKAYIVDMAISDKRELDRVMFADNYNLANETYWGEKASVLAIITCGPVLTIDLTMKSADLLSSRGIVVYYEAYETPKDYVCPGLTSSRPPPTTTTTTTTSTTTNKATSPLATGLALSIVDYPICDQSTYILQCPTDYVIVLLATDLASSALPTQKCVYSPIDCFERVNTFDSACSNKATCRIEHISKNMSKCFGRRSDYLFISYQCVPTKNAGIPVAPPVELCNDRLSTNQPIDVQTSVVIQSYSYPNYAQNDMSCKIDVITRPGKAFKVYVLDVSMRPTQNCNDTSDFVKVSNCIETIVFCDTPNYARLLTTPAASNTFTIEFSATKLGFTNSFQKGFRIYVETIDAQSSCPSTSPHGHTTKTTTTTTTNSPADYLGFVGPVNHVDICADTDVLLICPIGYYTMVTREFYYSTGTDCKHSVFECKQPGDLAYEKCASQEQCRLFVPKSLPLELCDNKHVDILEIEYVCLPANVPTLKVFTCSDVIIDEPNGYITSPGYPNYISGIVNCLVQIKSKIAHGLNVYIVQLAMSDATEQGICARDFLKVNDNEKLCSKERPRLLLNVNSDVQDVNVSHRGLTEQEEAANSESLNGFKLYFERYLLSDNTTKPIITLGTTEPMQTSPDALSNSNRSKVLTGWSLGLGIPIVFLLFFGIFYLLRNRQLMSRTCTDGGGSGGANTSNTRINYTKQTNPDINDIKSFENPNFMIENNIF